MLEPYALKGARAVLRRVGGRKASRLFAVLRRVGGRKASRLFGIKERKKYYEAEPILAIDVDYLWL
jgi:hypothetical protein